MVVKMCKQRIIFLRKLNVGSLVYLTHIAGHFEFVTL
jgi:hypothetical protein